MTQRYEYLTHALKPLQPGPAGQTTANLNVLAAQGWRLVSAQAIPAAPSIANPDMVVWALLVVMEREITPP